MQRVDHRRQQVWVSDPDLHGSAAFADAAHLQERGYGPHGRHVLGYLPAEGGSAGAVSVSYNGDRHEMVLAPTRGGKGVSVTIPRLLEHPGSAIVLDIKDGELARITARYRRDVLGQDVFLIDPDDIAASALGFTPARFDPMAGVDVASDHAFDAAYGLGDALILPGGTSESHWDGEAAALLAGLILREAELGGTLGDVRAALNLGEDDLAAYLAGMEASGCEAVRAAWGRITGKADRERSGVFSTAQRNTHFLESRKLAASLAGCNIDLSMIGRNTTIYIILPASRIRTARSYLRLLIGTLIGAVARLEDKPSPSVLFVLEEMATLGRMGPVEDGVGLMAGLGMQFLLVWQDLSQLRQLYQHRWESFVANCASLQCLGTNDRFTAQYLSDLCGQASVERVSYDSAARRASLLGDPDYRSQADTLGGRKLITPDELMRLHPCLQLITLAAAKPALCYRPAYFLERRFRDRRARPLYGIHPHHAEKPLPKAFTFTRPGLDLAALLSPHLKVG